LGKSPDVDLTAHSAGVRRFEGRMSNLSFEFEYFPWGCDYYLKNGRLMPEDGLEQPGRF